MSATITVVGKILEIQDLVLLGVPNGWWQVTGLILFFVSLTVVAFQNRRGPEIAIDEVTGTPYIEGHGLPFRPGVRIPTPEEVHAPRPALTANLPEVGKLKAENEDLRRDLRESVLKAEKLGNALSEAHVESAGRIARLEHELTESVSALGKAETYRNGLIATIENLQEQNSVLASNLAGFQYRANVPRFDKLSDLDAAIALSEMEKLKSALERAEEGAKEVARILYNWLVEVRDAGSQDSQFHLTAVAFDQMISSAHSTRALFLDTISSHGDARGPLVAFYHRYNELRRWIPKVAMICGKDLPNMPDHREYRARDKVFFEELNRALKIHQLAGVAKQRRAIDAERHYPEPPVDDNLST